MAINTQVAGEIIWNLKADLKQLETGLDRAQAALDGTVKEGGEKLDFFKGKFMVLGAAAIGAAYAMIKSSPSLAYGMEEISLRFQHLAAIIGEEFFPIISELILPALDALIPVFEEIAPMIGQVVGIFVEQFKKLQPIFERVLEVVMMVLGRIFAKFDDPAFQEMFTRLVDALGRIATVIFDIAEPALDLLFDIIDELQPIFMTLVTEGVEFLADALEAIEPIITAVLEWFDDVIEYISDSGFLTVVLKAITLLFDGFRAAIDLVKNAIFFLIDKIRSLIDWLAQIDMSKVAKILSLLPGPGGPLMEYALELQQAGYPTPPATGAGGEPLPPYQAGGYVFRTGPAMLHEGDVVLGRNERRGGLVIQKIEINVQTGPISSGMDVRRMARQTATEFKYELERKVFI